MYSFADKVKVGKSIGVIVGSCKARKWTYYHIVFEGAEYHVDDWMTDTVEYDTYREDQIEYV